MVYKRCCAFHFELLSNSGFRAYPCTNCLWAYWALCGPGSWPNIGLQVISILFWPSRWHFLLFLKEILKFQTFLTSFDIFYAFNNFNRTSTFYNFNNKIKKYSNINMGHQRKNSPQLVHSQSEFRWISINWIEIHLNFAFDSVQDTVDSSMNDLY